MSYSPNECPSNLLPKGERIMAVDVFAELMKALMQKLYQNSTANGDGTIKTQIDSG